MAEAKDIAPPPGGMAAVEASPEAPAAVAQPEAEVAPGAGEAETPPDPKAARIAELEELLGPDLKTPAGIPADYRPSEGALSPMFKVELPGFIGPLDLLLYLVKKHDLDIFDIPIRFITQRYLELLRVLKALEIDLAAEFLVLAADLSHIKSKMLLPAKEGVAVEEDPEDDSDPRAELVRRLLEYQKYRDAAHDLADRDQLGRDTFARVPPAEGESELDPGLKRVDVFKLLELMARMLKKKPRSSHEISFEDFSLAERIHFLMRFGMARERRFTVVELVEGIETRAELVVTFIAVLEATKLQLVRLEIEEDSVGGALMPEAFEGAPPEEPAAPSDAAEGPAEPAPEAPLSEAEALRQEAAALEREVEQLAAEDARLAAEQAEAAARAAEQEAEPWPADPLPTIWVVLTGKRFEGDIMDDYL